MAFFGINFLIFGLYFLSGIQVINFLYASASYFAFSFLACLVPISVFYAINSLTQKPMNRFVKLFWLLPFINLVYGLILKHVALDVLALNYYDNWYTDLATYYRPLFFVVVLLEIRNLDRYSETVNFYKNQLKFLSFLWAKWFLIFQAIKTFITIGYLFLTLANGRLFDFKSDFLTYSQDNYNTIQLVLIAYFTFIFGYLAIRNAKVFKAKSLSKE